MNKTDSLVDVEISNVSEESLGIIDNINTILKMYGTGW